MERDLDTAELAEVLGCGLVAAHGRLHRARRRFRDLYRSLLHQRTEQPPDHGSVLITGERHR